MFEGTLSNLKNLRKLRKFRKFQCAKGIQSWKNLYHRLALLPTQIPTKSLSIFHAIFEDRIEDKDITSGFHLDIQLYALNKI